jgi:hypothetical protein
MDVKYERIERTDSPSIMTINFGPSAIKGGTVKLYISNSLVKELGTQRIIPAPKDSTVGNGGITYTFSASELPASVDMALQPAGPGIFEFAMRVEGAEQIRARIVVVP